jgi:hypothetical protein
MFARKVRRWGPNARLNGYKQRAMFAQVVALFEDNHRAGCLIKAQRLREIKQFELVGCRELNTLTIKMRLSCSKMARNPFR